MSIWSRIKAFGPWSRAQKERDLQREIQNHLDLEAEESGQYGARRAFGNKTLVSEDVRAEWGWTLLERLLQDARYGLRQVRRNPAFSTIAIVTLALGIGANAAMFSVVDAVLIRRLPYANADRLVMIWEDFSSIGYRHGTPAPGMWQQWRRENSVFTDIAATSGSPVNLSGDGEPEQLQGRRVTANFWTVLGAQPVFGRVFTEDEDTHRAPVAVISHGLWLRRFGGAHDVIGRKIIVNDSPVEIIGVMPREFYFLPNREIDIWMPAAFTAKDLSNFGSHYLWCVARLKPGISLRQASASMIALSKRLAEGRDSFSKALVVPLREDLAGKTATSLVVLLCASATILLIACVNLANLLLSRGATRKREVAVRAALGANRGRLVAQFVMESLLLAALGAVAGLALALPTMQFLERLVPQTMVAVHLSLDWRVLAFSAMLAVVAALAFGLAPALGISRAGPQEGLTEGARGTVGKHSSWLQHTLVVAETALAAALLTSAGFLLQTLWHLQRVDLGIRTEKLLTMVTPLSRYREFDKRVAFVNSMLERIRAVPGVVNAGAINDIPVGGCGCGSDSYVFAGEPREKWRGRDALARVVTRDYFAAIGAALREGRFFDFSDRATNGPGAEMSAIVNEAFADRNFPNRSALSARFQFSNLGPGGDWYNVVGVVKDIRERGVAAEQKAAVYVLNEQAGKNFTAPSGLVIRTSVKPESIVPAVRDAIRSVDGNEPIARIQTLDAIIARQLAEPSQDTALLGAFAALALIVACIGLYGVLSYLVSQRTNEIGVRMALGATSDDILLSFGKRGLELTLAGLAAGLVLAAIASRLMTTLLYGFRPEYIPMVAAVSVILVVVAALACLVPARRASRIDPMAALRYE